MSLIRKRIFVGVRTTVSLCARAEQLCSGEMRKRTVKQIDREIKRLTKRIKQLERDRAMLLVGIEPRNQLCISLDPPPKPKPPPRRPEQLMLV